jgi:DNA-binding transcriptional LysR family regulator
VTPADLATTPFLGRERGSGTREVAEAALASHGVSLRIALRLSSTEAIIHAVAAGLGVAIVSRAAIEDQLALGGIVVIRLRGLSFPRALNELRLTGAPQSPAAAVFRRVLREGEGARV